MGSGGSQSQQQNPGTLSPVTATLMDLFGGTQIGNGGQYIPRDFGGPNATFTTGDFGNIAGLLQNQPLSGTEGAILGVGQNGTFGENSGVTGLALNGALQGQDLLQRTAGAITTDPAAAIAQARRGFTEETIPGILERAPGFSSSDLQRELVRGGTDLETNIGALRDAHQLALAQTVPGLSSALGSNLLNAASEQLGFGQLGRQFISDVSPAGDAFRVLTALQSLTGPALTTAGQGKSKNVGVL